MMGTVRPYFSVACLVSLAFLTRAGVARAQETKICIDASEKALALSKVDKLIDARASLSTCAASICPDIVRTFCAQRVEEVNRAIPSIVFFAKDGSGHDLAAVTTTIDGTLYADRLDGSAIVLDPGEHEFRFNVAGQEPVVKRFVLHQGEQNRHEDIVIGGAPPPRAPTAPGNVKDGSAQRTIGLGVGGVGLAGLVVGGIFGALSMSAHNRYEQNCGSTIGAPSGYCNSAGQSGESDAATKGTISTIFFIGGGVVGAAGAVLFFTAPRAPAPTQIGVGPGTVWIAREF